MTPGASAVSRAAADGGELIVRFPSEAAANFPVAGIPAAARVVRAVTEAALTGRVVIAVPGGWEPSALCRSEWERLPGGVQVLTADLAASRPPSEAMTLLERHHGRPQPATGTVSEDEPAAAIRRLRALHRAIIRSTTKPGDGIVSRYLNRPISQAISSLVLRLFPAARPIHATFAVAICAAAMVIALVAGGTTGAVAGAILFQAASILDGVDGEIARASHRASRSGATLDSVTDALTNLGFISGLSINLYQQGEVAAALAGAIGLLVLAVGLVLLGHWSYRRDGRVHFDIMKERVARSPGKVGQALAKIFMRDFYALAFAVLVVAGAGAFGLWIFALAALGWAVTVTVAFVRHGRA